MVTYTAHGMREVRAQKEYTCEHCGGAIFRKERYWNYHSEDRIGNWRGRRHLDCGAAWWQGDTISLLSAVALLPGTNPPDAEKEPMLQDIPVCIVAKGEHAHVSVVFSEYYNERLLHTKDLALRREALTQIGRVQALVADCIAAVSGNQKKSKQLSNALQQMAQIAGLSAPTNGRGDT